MNSVTYVLYREDVDYCVLIDCGEWETLQPVIERIGKSVKAVLLTHGPKISRKEETRTPDPYVPNVVRYQLRYFPIIRLSHCKGMTIHPNHQIFSLFS